MTSEFIEGFLSFLCNFLWIFEIWKPYQKPKTIFSSVFLFILPVLYTIFVKCFTFFLVDFLDPTNRLFILRLRTEVALAMKIINCVLQNDKWQQIYNEIRKFHIKSNSERKTGVDSHSRILQNFDYIAIVGAFLKALFPVIEGISSLIYSGWYPGLMMSVEIKILRHCFIQMKGDTIVHLELIKKIHENFVNGFEFFDETFEKQT